MDVLYYISQKCWWLMVSPLKLNSFENWGLLDDISYADEIELEAHKRLFRASKVYGAQYLGRGSSRCNLFSLKWVCGGR